MFGKPLLAHPAERGGVQTTWHPHPGDDDDRDRHDDEADDEQHKVPAATRSFLCVWRSLHSHGPLSVRLCTGLECVNAVASRRQYRLAEAPVGTLWPCVHSGTAPFSPRAYSCDMQLGSLKAVLAIVWISAVLIAGLAGNLNSISSWALLAGVALLPPIVMMLRWNTPAQTMSESIQEARR